MNRLTQSKYATILPVLIALTLGCFGLSPTVWAVDPPPDGGYPNQNTAEGEDALFSLSTGQRNTAIGFNALFKNTTGNANTAIGMSALYNNTTGGGNIALGENALALNTTGLLNTAIGGNALLSNTVGNFNTATGYVALALNTTGIKNTAEGYGALYNNTTGNYNTASGQGSLQGNTTGRNNTAIGQNALARNTIGSHNIAVGSNAGSNVTTGSNNIDIFERGVAGESNTIRIGRVGTHTATYVAGISGITVAGGVGVVIDTNGHLGTIVSSARYKDNIQPMSKSSEAILALKPVTFRYKQELDPDSIPQFGLVAEQVEKVNPDLVARDEQGKPYTVRYEAVNAMLLNEFLKEHRKEEEQAATITDLKSAVAQQQKDIAALTAALKAQAAQIQKVSDQLKTKAVAPRVVAND